MKQKLSIREYMIKYFPNEYKEIIKQGSEEAKKMALQYPEIKKMRYPFVVPMNTKYAFPEMSYLTFDEKGDEIND